MTSSQTPVPMSTLLAHREWVRRLARSLVRDDASADDVEQRTWLAALRSPPRDAGRARAWLARVVRNQALDSFRAEARRDVHERTAARADSVRAAADVVAEAESQKRVVVAVCGLAEPYRTTMLLRFYEDLPPRDVAARMDVPVETVRTRIRRGADLVRAQLGGDRSAWLAALTPLAAAKTAGGLVMKGSTKAAVVTVVVLAAVGALGWLAVEMNRDETDAASATSSPGSPAKASADRAGASLSRTPRNRSADPANNAASAAPAASLATTPSADAAQSRAAREASNQAATAPASRTATPPAGAFVIHSPPRPQERLTSAPLPSTAADLLDLLGKKASPPIPASELADDGGLYARSFVRESLGVTIDPLTADPAAEMAAGTRILFPAGCFRWDTTTFSPASGPKWRQIPDDVLVEGAGMDSTLVVPTARIVARKARGLTFKNLTIHCNDEVLLAFDAGLVHFDHVRIIGFDGDDPRASLAIAGGCAIAVLAEDCRIESGFGSGPGHANWLLATSPYTSKTEGWLTIARFDRCTFCGPFEKRNSTSIFFPSPPGAIVCANCDLLDSSPHDRAAFEHPEQTPAGWVSYLRFENCTVTYAPASDGTPRKRRDVSELNPAWTMPPMAAPK